MTFMNRVVQNIWEKPTKEYRALSAKCMDMTAEDLYERIKHEKIYFLEKDSVVMSALLTCGCRRHITANGLGGCSFCNYHSKAQQAETLLEVLNIKSPQLYAKAVKECFLNARGQIRQRNIHELVFGHDFLNKVEFPGSIYDDLFSADIYMKKPIVFEFEADAASVSIERLRELKQAVGKSQIIIRIGIECSDEWLRIHWLNKNITNKQIMDAVEKCHSLGMKVTGNVLLGIPGVTEKQSIKVFHDSMKWMEDIDVDIISIAPLNRKPFTLQNWLYENLSENASLQNVGLVYKDHFGLPWLFTVIEAIAQAYFDNPSVINKIAMGQFGSKYIVIDHQLAFNDDYSCSCYEDIFHVIENFAFKRNIEDILSCCKEMKHDKCYKQYNELIMKQEKAGNLMNTLSLLAYQISQHITQDSQELYQAFKNEVGQK